MMLVLYIVLYDAPCSMSQYTLLSQHFYISNTPFFLFNNHHIYIYIYIYINTLSGAKVEILPGTMGQAGRASMAKSLRMRTLN
jgi:hypothetical protein